MSAVNPMRALGGVLTMLGLLLPSILLAQEATQEARHLWHLGGEAGEAVDERYIFGQLASLHLDGAGRVWVVDTQLQNVRAFDQDGAFLRSIGRRGPGPGEFEAPFGLAVTDGLVVVRDLLPDRYQVFDTLGVPRRTLPYRSIRPDRSRMDASSDRAFDLWSLEPRYPGGSTDPWVVGFDPESGDDVTRLQVPNPPPAVIQIPYDDGLILPLEVPFSPELSWTVDRAGSIYWTDGRSYRIRVVRPGDRGWSGEWQPPRRSQAISAADREVAVDELVVARLRVFAESTGVDLAPHLTALERAMPEAWPEILGLHSDGAGQIFAEVPPPEPGVMAFDRWDTTGRRIGTITVRIPEGKRRVWRGPLSIGGGMLVVALQGDFDEHELHAYRLPE